MSAKQQMVTAVMGLLMLGTIFAMPAHDPRKAQASVRHTGSVLSTPEARAELPTDQVRDFTYN